MKLSFAATALMLLASAGYAEAQNTKPGLWEFTTQMQGGSGKAANDMAQAQKQLESMPPEQRKMLQNMMAKQGVQMGTGAGGGMSVKMCLTQEMVDRNEVSSRRDGCTHTNSPRSGNNMKFSFVCTKPPGSGKGEITFTGPEAYTMKMISTTTVHGSPELMEIQSSGRWLGTDCGNVRPIALPKK